MQLRIIFCHKGLLDNCHMSREVEKFDDVWKNEHAIRDTRRLTFMNDLKVNEIVTTEICQES